MSNIWVSKSVITLISKFQGIRAYRGQNCFTKKNLIWGNSYFILASLQDIYHRRVYRRACSSITDYTHPPNTAFFTLMPPGRRCWGVKCRTSRLRDRFYPQAIRRINRSNPLPLPPHTFICIYLMPTYKFCRLTLYVLQILYFPLFPLSLLISYLSSVSLLKCIQSGRQKKNFIVQGNLFFNGVYDNKRFDLTRFYGV